MHLIFKSAVSYLSLCIITLFFYIPVGNAVSSEAKNLNHHEAGRDIYNFRCYFCHGYSGDGRTLAGRFMEPTPRDFTSMVPEQKSRQTLIDSVTHGIEGTGMKSFANTLTTAEIGQVVDFVREEFIRLGRPNTRYHTLENGWPNHNRYQIAFEFATGKTALDTAAEQLNPTQRQGLDLFMKSCISCHDRSLVSDGMATWKPEAVSYPRLKFKTGDFLLPADTISGPTPFAKHDIPLDKSTMSKMAQKGGKLFEDNCAFCHAADGSGKNWIGTFLEPHPRDLTDSLFMSSMSKERMRHTIREGLINTSMPAWKSVLSVEQIEEIIAFINEAMYPMSGE